MSGQLVAAGSLGVAGVICAALAVRSERHMHRHRQPGVTWAAATLRPDGGWRRAELFTPAGLRHQVAAARLGFATVVCWVLALITLVLFAE